MFPPLGMIVKYIMSCIGLVISDIEVFTLKWHEFQPSVRQITDYANINLSGPTASASGSGPAAPSKRREQVRHAQRYVSSS